MTSINYYSKIYPKDHWAVLQFNNKDNNFICILKYEDMHFLVKLNPTDSRGYRTIISLIHDDMNSTFNREYNLEEITGLMHICALCAYAFKKLKFVVQIEVAGNNSQKLEENNIVLGNENEPSMLHAHLICRGDPRHAYITDVPLKGPIIGEIFNMRGNSLEEGNNKKEKWNEGDMILVTKVFAYLIDRAIIEKNAGIELIDICNYKN